MNERLDKKTGESNHTDMDNSNIRLESIEEKNNKKVNSIKLGIMRFLVFVAAVLLVLAPFLLVLDLKYAPMVLFIWIISVAYFMYIKRNEWISEKMKREIQEKIKDKNSE